MYLSRYNSVPLSYQCLNPDTISSAVNVNHGHELVIDQLQTDGCDQLSMSPQNQPMPNQWARSAINISMLSLHNIR